MAKYKSNMFIKSDMLLYVVSINILLLLWRKKMCKFECTGYKVNVHALIKVSRLLRKCKVNVIVIWAGFFCSHLNSFPLGILSHVFGKKLISFFFCFWLVSIHEYWNLLQIYIYIFIYHKLRISNRFITTRGKNSIDLI